MKPVSRSEAINRKFPESVVLIVTRDTDGSVNVMPAGWSMFTSGDPLMLAISVGLPRHTHAVLERTEELVIAFPSEAQTEDIVFCGSCTGAEVDKIAESGLEPIPATKVDVPLLKKATACFECRKGPAMKTGDHTIFANEVVATHASEQYPERVKNLGREYGDGPARFKTLSQMLAGEVQRPVAADD